jgi:hypothetical protein
MSNALAIAGVTAVLKDLLNNGVIDHELTTKVGHPVTVTALPPDRIKVGEDELPQINLFLYHVAPNAGWRNVALPSRDGLGDRIANPPLALDLYYLLTAYGMKDFDGEILLGYAMQMLHETPVLPRQAIRTALGTPPNGAPPVTGDILLPLGPFVATDLADQVEQIKIAPQSMNTEEVSKLWTALQARYRPTAAYQVSVVLIESSKPAKSALPVTKRNLVALPFSQPFIEEIDPQTVLAGGTITLRGRNLRGQRTKLNFGTTALADPTSATDSEIVATAPGELPAGVNGVQVVHQIEFGTPADPHSGFESNVVPFILAPQITPAMPVSVKPGEPLTLGINPPVGRNQRASLLIAERSITADAPKAEDPPGTRKFQIPTDFPLIPPDVTVRVQVDGAQSPVDIDKDPKSPTFGQITGPKITVTA